MSQLKSILAAIDFSEPSLNALDTAMHFTEKHGADLYIVNARETFFEAAGIHASPGYSVTKNSSNVLAALASDIQRKIKIKPVIIEEEGFVPEIVLKNTVKYNCDLIIMGTYGASGYRNGYIGSNTYSIVKFGPCPVLLIPGGKRLEGFSKPLFPVRPVMPAIKNYDILKNYLSQDSTLYVLGLSPFAREGTMKDLNRVIAEIQSKLADEIDIKTQWSESNAIADNVLIQADKNNTDLIILTPAIDVSSKQFYIGPIAHRIIHHARVPILIINRVNVYAGRATVN
jgi:nucleotide-binding universal stress UspA family protein